MPHDNSWNSNRNVEIFIKSLKITWIDIEWYVSNTPIFFEMWWKLFIILVQGKMFEFLSKLPQFKVVLNCSKCKNSSNFGRKYLNFRKNRYNSDQELMENQINWFIFLNIFFKMREKLHKTWKSVEFHRKLCKMT